MKPRPALVVFAWLLTSCATLPADASSNTVHVVDGDTFDLNNQRIRIIGINTPEKDECGAPQAAQALTALLNGPIQLTVDTSNTDQYGRLLRYVTVDDVDVGLFLIENGWAIARRYPPDTAHHDQYSDAQTAARAAGVGIWDPTLCDPNPPTNTNIRLDIDYNPPGDDTAVLNNETITITNLNPQNVDITNWTLSDESSSHRYTFTATTILQPNQPVTVHSGCGTPTTTDHYWCARTGVWNNTGDTAFLKTPAGAIIATRTY